MKTTPKKHRRLSKQVPRKKTSKRIRRKIFGIAFQKQLLLEAALTHPSYRNENIPKKLENFDRLEFFGDAILNFAVCRKLYALFPDADEGVLSRLRSILVSRKILSRIAQELKLPVVLKLGKSLVKQKLFLKAKIFADSLEAFIAALYFDKGFPAAEKFILKHFEEYFDAKKLFRLDPNPKSTLQEIVQKHWQRLPIYVSESSADGTKTAITITPQIQAVATARTRKESEEKAARVLIRTIRQELLGRSNKKSSGSKARKTF